MISAKPFNLFCKVESNKYRVVTRINEMTVGHAIEMQHHIIFFCFRYGVLKLNVIGKHSRACSDGAPFPFVPMKDVSN